MSGANLNGDCRVAVLVDCDNVSPNILEHALKVVAQFGRVVLRRGYGNHSSLTNRWQETLVQLAFTPCLQFQYASGKNTADLALALDAMEAMFDDRVDTFCLVTSDSDFSYLCRKLRERGSTVYIVGEPKTPNALRNASDQFFEWSRQNGEENPPAAAIDSSSPKRRASDTLETNKIELKAPTVKKRPMFLVDAVDLLASDTAEGKVEERVGVRSEWHFLKQKDLT